MGLTRGGPRGVVPGTPRMYGDVDRHRKCSPGPGGVKVADGNGWHGLRNRLDQRGTGPAPAWCEPEGALRDTPFGPSKLCHRSASINGGRRPGRALWEPDGALRDGSSVPSPASPPHTPSKPPVSPSHTGFHDPAGPMPAPHRSRPRWGASAAYFDGAGHAAVHRCSAARGPRGRPARRRSAEASSSGPVSIGKPSPPRCPHVRGAERGGPARPPHCADDLVARCERCPIADLPAAEPGKPRQRVEPGCLSPHGDHSRPVPEQPLVRGDPHARVLDLPVTRVAPELPGELAHLGDRLGRHRLAERGESAAHVDGYAPARRRRPLAQELRALALPAQSEVLVPLQLQGGGQVVHLGQREILRPTPASS